MGATSGLRILVPLCPLVVVLPSVLRMLEELIDLFANDVESLFHSGTGWLELGRVLVYLSHNLDNFFDVHDVEDDPLALVFFSPGARARLVNCHLELVDEVLVLEEVLIIALTVRDPITQLFQQSLHLVTQLSSFEILNFFIERSYLLFKIARFF